MSGPGDARRARLARARLYLVTDARQAQGDLKDFLDVVLGAGVDIVQLREKHAEAGDLLRWSKAFRAASDRNDALFVLNDRPDVALAAGADGVHVGQNDLDASVVRKFVGPDIIIGLSTHSPDEYDTAPPDADYLCAGPVHATPTKPGRPATGIEFVSHAALRARDGSERRPWFAIGGIDPTTIPDIVAAGATRIVVVRAITAAADPGEAARILLAELPGFPAHSPAAPNQSPDFR
jgi:thiamine-phosphate pyrophosphorylase